MKQIKVVVMPKQAIISKKRLRKAIAGGLSLGIMILTGMVFAKVMQTAYQAMIARTGLPGGEILVFPALCLAFFWGWQIKDYADRRSGDGQRQDD